MLRSTTLLGVFLLTSSLHAATEKKDPPSPKQLAKISKSFGHVIGKNLESLDMNFDIKELLQGIEESVAGKKAPMSETECVQAISLIQENVFQKKSEENLKTANTFLKKNRKQKGIVELEKGKLQCCIKTAGKGPQVQPHFSPMIRYTGKLLDGHVFGSSKEEEIISLDETIPGFTKGIIGMHEGEKRTLYIHPELGYGTTGFLPPNSLLTFEIEVVKANASKKEKESLSSSPNKEPKTDEIASPKEGIR